MGATEEGANVQAANGSRGQTWVRLCLAVALTVSLAVVLGWFVLNPLWDSRSAPFPMPKVTPAIMAPVDGPFYVQNASQGYEWKDSDGPSLWFHPLMSVLPLALTHWLSTKAAFWAVSLLFSLVAAFVTVSVLRAYGASLTGREYLLAAILAAPGGLGLATGNAEIPTLVFSSALLLLVIKGRRPWLVATVALLAILTKPNALYMVPVLLVYLLWALRLRDRRTIWSSAAGIAGVVGGWLLWMVIVDIQAGQFGTYLSARAATGSYSLTNIWRFFEQTAHGLLGDGGLRDGMRFGSALVVPLASIWAIGAAKFSEERHRYAAASGVAAMFGLAVLQSNPNKLLVYATTLPAHFPVHLMAIQALVLNHGRMTVARVTGSFLYLGYCGLMILVYVYGTPSGWYY